jgi:hypothetical protein
MNHYALTITSLFLMTPVIKNFIQTSDKFEIVFDCLYILTFIVSIIFWMNPVRNGIRHKFDSVFAKLSICTFTGYALFYKDNTIIDKLIYLLGFFMTISMFMLSHSCSRLKWCSQNHIITHFWFHLIIFIMLFEYL